ncbi:MAG: hypothetical protein KC776_26965 [Myxococcales bacterium]|nr:hypothetical protein [Myxococcales bacterium]MCB9575405.1 hypothetical protein [Polyangiaceae bacterium]
MGWLRELMASRDPPVRSFGSLARAALDHPSWPESVSAQPRSLAAVLSKLDRDQELEWLADRPDAQRVLAELLGCSVPDLQHSAWPGRARAVEDPARRLRLEDARFARSLDLLEDALPPGIPPEVVRPEGWGRLWWRAPSGSGRTLAGRWLAARGLAVFEQGSGAELPPRRPAFVELEGEPHRALGRDAICVASASVPREFVRAHGFRVIDSPAPRQFLPALVDWMRDRLPADGHFDSERVLTWLLSSELVGEREGTLGIGIGLCGLMDELGSSDLTGRSVEDLSRRFLRQRLSAAADSGSADAAWLRRNAYDVLLALARSALTDSDDPWHMPRTEDEWLELVPEELRQGADVDWLRLSLRQIDTTIRPSDVDKAARRIPPGAFRIVRGLRAARILVPVDDERLAVAPHWLARAAERDAIRGLLGASPFEWGEALLGRRTATVVLGDLWRDLSIGRERALSDVSELSDDDSPAQVAAVEAVFRCAGLSLLLGVEIDGEQLGELWDDQKRLWIELDGEPPRPRVGHTDDPRAPSDVGWFWLAALAVSERVSRESGGRRAAGALNPWLDDEAPSFLPMLLDGVRDALYGAFDAPELRAGALRLLERLRQATRHPLHDLERPGHALAAAKSGALGFDDVARIDARCVADLPRFAGTDLGVLCASAWHAWQRAESPTLTGTLLDPSLLPASWEHVPVAVLGPALARAAADQLSPPFDRLTPEHWTALSAAPAKVGSAHADAFWRAVPADVGAELLSAERVPALSSSAGWRRFEELLAPKLDVFLRARPEAAGAWLGCVPDALTERVAQALSASPLLSTLPGSAVDAIRRFALDAVRRRVPAFRAAYALMSELEKSVDPRRFRH